MTSHPHPKPKQPALTPSQEDKLFTILSHWEAHLERRDEANDLRSQLKKAEERAEWDKQECIKAIVDAVNHPVEPIALRRIAKIFTREFPNTALSYSTLYYHVNK